ncbi:MAG: bifunctional nuclease family protein [Armatimonadota bacterium]|nr:bifunctional nuclease family protein [Armatimonadota bacterium]MCX7778500.1 bifunctional nuclease family protein [Armatimonadota bacterium]MDW8025774.1 bifunctional nuclease family protein [Armatimonadota bacterium]
MIEIRVANVGQDKNGNFILLLKEPTSGAELPIWIGEFEALAIDMELRHIKPQRPMTHDLLASILNTLGIEMECAIINELVGDTYYAAIVLRWGDEVYEIDSRPSDAVAIALRLNAPIYLSEELAKMLNIHPTKRRDHDTERFMRLVGDIELPEW